MSVRYAMSTPLVLTPDAHAFLAAIADNRVLVAVGFAWSAVAT